MEHTMSHPVIDTPADLTPAWLSGALGGRVDGVTAERVGADQIGSCYRLTLTGEGVPELVLAKFPAEDPGSRAMLAAPTGVNCGSTPRSPPRSRSGPPPATTPP